VIGAGRPSHLGCYRNYFLPADPAHGDHPVLPGSARGRRGPSSFFAKAHAVGFGITLYFAVEEALVVSWFAGPVQSQRRETRPAPSLGRGGPYRGLLKWVRAHNSRVFSADIALPPAPELFAAHQQRQRRLIREDKRFPFPKGDLRTPPAVRQNARPRIPICA